MSYMSLHTLNAPAERRFALFDLGFRPMYLLAGTYAALGVPIWALQYAGVLPGANMLWHAHEMLFGIAALWLAARLIAPFSLPAAAATCSSSPWCWRWARAASRSRPGRGSEWPSGWTWCCS